MSMPNDFNQKIITEFRANGGKVGEPFANAPLLLLITTGAKSGQSRVNPLVYATDGDRIVIFASKAGAPTNPDWYHNILAQPLVHVEIGSESYQARATVAGDADRDRLFAQMAARNQGFADYQEKTTRRIPVVFLDRIA